MKLVDKQYTRLLDNSRKYHPEDIAVILAEDHFATVSYSSG